MMTKLRKFITAVTATIGLLVIMATTEADAKTPSYLVLPAHAKMVVMGGTDDPFAEDQLKRVETWQIDTVDTVPYPASFKPYKGDYTYNESVGIGKDNLKQHLREENSPVVVISMSQGGRVVGDVANELDTPEKASKVSVISMGDPRFPQTGMETVYGDVDIPGVVDTAGERPATEYVSHKSVCIKGDPVCSGFNGPVDFAYGFVCTHSGSCPGIDYNYSHLDELEVADSRTVGETEYILLDAPHPGAQIAEANGIVLDNQQVALLEQALPIAAPDL